MSFERIPTTRVEYGLISYGAEGRERLDDPAGRMSEVLVQRASRDGITDIFFFCHGWMGDVAAARDQYNSWIKAFGVSADASQAANTPRGFRPLYIGLHWPSLPWGDEELTAGGSFAAAGGGTSVGLLETYLQRLGDRPEIRGPLQVILDEARRNMAPESLPPHVRDAYLQLNRALGLQSEGVDAPPDADREEFDPEESFEAGNEESASFGGDLDLGGLLGPLRQLSYWTMKKRARTVGEGGMHDFLNYLQAEAPDARIHLMGHSFGTIVVSGMMGGPNASAKLQRPVDSVALVQSAVSLWSYASSIPFAGAGPGYFNRILADRKIRGPLVTTRSKWDKAVGVFYPLASRLKGSVEFAGGFPKYGAIGAFGIQGLPDSVRRELPMAAVTDTYNFEQSKIYNLDASQYISHGAGASGAHSDIAGPEVAHAIWAAAAAGGELNLGGPPLNAMT
jgi:hypothetical protein